jgi:uncharacterized membrane protein
MTYSPVLILHVCAAMLTVPFGMAALFFRKGARLHRTFGNVFFVSMLIMSASGAYIGLMKHQASNVIAGSLTFYLVATAWVTVKREAGETGLFELAAMLVALAAGTSSLIIGREVVNSASAAKDGIPPAPYFIFGFVALLAAALDVSVLIRHGVSGAQRIARHLWRMCFALLIATLSLFIGKQQHFPEAIRHSPLMNAPVILVIVMMIFWVCRVLFSNAYKVGGARVIEISGSSSPSQRSLAPLS